MSLTNPVAGFYELYLNIINYALPEVFTRFLNLIFFAWIFLVVYKVLWSVK